MSIDLQSQLPSNDFGQWTLTEARELFDLTGIKVFDCVAIEHHVDQYGLAADGTGYLPPDTHHFLAGCDRDGHLLWLRDINRSPRLAFAHDGSNVIATAAGELLLRINGSTGVDDSDQIIFQRPRFLETCLAIAPDFERVNLELVDHFARHPEELHRLDPRKFEKLLEAIFRNLGYDTQIGTGRGDAGIDLRLLHKDSVGEIITLVQAKRYHPTRPIELEAVAALYGIVENEKANRGLFVTTSRYLPSAQRFASQQGRRLSLATPTDVAEWCRLVAQRASFEF